MANIDRMLNTNNNKWLKTHMCVKGAHWVKAHYTKKGIHVMGHCARNPQR